MLRTFTLRLLVNKSQESALSEIVKDCQETYNAALQERIEAWKMERKSITMYEQFGELTELRKDDRFSQIAADIQRDPLRRLDKAFKAFFRRCKSGEKPGFPRFRSRARYDSFGFHLPKVKVDRLHIPNLGNIRFKAHQELRGKMRFCTLQRVGSKWQARIVCDIGPAPEKQPVSNAVGIDLGLNALVTLSDGTKIANPRWTRKHERRTKAAQRRLALKQKRSKNRLRAREVLRRASQRATNARTNYLHHASKWLVSNYDLIAHEDLKIRNMTRSARGTVENHGNNVKQKAGLNRSILDAAWSQLLLQLAYKAEGAGRYLIAVDPRGTSQICSGCGKKVPKDLSQRTHSCECGTVLDRDHNAAINVLKLGLGMSLAGASLQNVYLGI